MASPAPAPSHPCAVHASGIYPCSATNHGDITPPTVRDNETL